MLTLGLKRKLGRRRPPANASASRSELLSETNSERDPWAFRRASDNRGGCEEEMAEFMGNSEIHSRVMVAIVRPGVVLRVVEEEEAGTLIFEPTIERIAEVVAESPDSPPLRADHPKGIHRRLGDLQVFDDLLGQIGGGVATHPSIFQFVVTFLLPCVLRLVS